MGKRAHDQSSHTYTPVRRPQVTINNARYSEDQGKDWTAARCHRLLRALTSRVAILTKDLARFQQQDGVVASAGRLSSKDNARSSRPQADDDWFKTKWPVARTYTTKGRKVVGKGQEKASTRGRKSINPGEVSIPTPILARVRGDLSLPAVIATTEYVQAEEPIAKSKRRRTCYTTAGDDIKFQLSGTLLQTRQNTPANRYSTYEGLYNGLETLLHSTKQPAQAPKHRGAGSLLSMALRAVPRHINEQEHMLQLHMETTGSKSAIENRDITAEIYDDLESYGSSGHGWKRLGVIVRAHGVKILADAIISGLLEVQFCGVLISLCIRMGAVDEGEVLLSALLASSSFPVPRTLSEQVAEPLRMLWKFAQCTGRTSFQLGKMAQMVCENQLPIEWLATKDFSSFWTSLLQTITPDNMDDEALELMEVLLLRLSGKSTPVYRGCSPVEEAVENTFSSLLTTLSSMLLLCRETALITETLGIPEGVSKLTDLLATCLRQSFAASRRANSKDVLLLLANIVVQDEATHAHEMVGWLCELSNTPEMQWDRLIYSTQAAMLICQVARCCGRGTSGMGFQYLQQMHVQLEVLACGQARNNVLKALVVDSAFAYAMKVPNHQHIEYATSMDATYCATSEEVKGMLADMSDRDTENNKSEFRWEEGIGEWVTTTPGTSTAKRAATTVDDNWEDSPFRPHAKLRGSIGNTPPAVTSSLIYSDGVDELYESSRDFSSLSTNAEVQIATGVVSTSEQSPNSTQPVELLNLNDFDSLPIVNDSRSKQNRLRTQHELQPSDQPVEHESDRSDSGADVDASTENSEMSFEEEYMSPEASPQPSSSPVWRQPHSVRRMITRTPRLTRKLFQSHQVFEPIFDSSNHSFTSIASTNSLADQREFVERVPRLGRRALRSSQAWQVFDESDDELSFLSTTSSSRLSVASGKQPLAETRKNLNVNKHARLPSAKQALKIVTRKRASSQLSESEDELCI